MRRLTRPELTLAERVDLYKRQSAIHSIDEGRKAWSRYRSQASSRKLISALKLMNGKTERCAYCSDSRGSEVDHFEPISPTYQYTFDWSNLFWVCGTCNRRKGNQSVQGSLQRLVLRPDKDEFWSSFFLDTETGVVTPRAIAPTFELDERAVSTLAVIPVLGFEAIEEHRAISVRRLRVAAEGYLLDPSRNFAQLLKALAEEHHGVKSWFTRSDGQREYPWIAIRNYHRLAWRRIVAVSAQP